MLDGSKPKRAVGYLWDGANHGLGQALTIVLPLLALTWINVRGIKAGAVTAVVLSLGKTLPLLLLVVVGFFAVSWKRIFPVPVPESGNFTKAALLVLYAYSGFENTSAPAGEFRNPKRDVPFALLIVQIADRHGDLHAGPVGRDRPHPQPGRLRHAAGRRGAGNHGAGGRMAPDARGGAVGARHEQQYDSVRAALSLRAGAGRAALPRVFARVHPRYHTPYVAIVTQSASRRPLTVSGTFGSSWNCR